MDNLEKTFKDALSDFDQISPSKGLWGRISRSMFFQSSMNTGLIVGTILLLLSVPAYYFLNKHTKETKSAIAEPSAKTTVYQQQKQRKEESGSGNPKEFTPKIALSPINSGTKEKLQTSDSPDKQNAQNTNTSKTSIQQNKLNDHTSPVTARASAKGKSPQQSNNNHMATPKAKSEAGFSVSGMAATTGDVGNISIFDEDAENKQQDKSKNIKPKNQARVRNTIRKPATSHTTATQNRMPEIQRIKPLYLAMENNEPIGAIDQNSLIPPYQHRPLYYSRIEIFAGPNIAFNILQSTDPSADAYVSLRKSSEQPKLSYHAGFSYKSFYKKWYISVGANFHRIQDRATYSLPTMDIDSTVSNFMVFHTTYNRTIVGYMTNPNDTSSLIPIYQATAIQDTSVITQILYDSTESINSYSFTNTYSYIEVPLLIGHQFHYKNLIFDLAGGISWNRLIQYEVSIPDRQNKQLLNSGQLDQMLVRNTFNAIFSAGVGYGINEGKVIFIRPEFRYNLNNMFEHQVSVQQNYIQVRLSLGMQFQF
jgi:hypothetical protein